VGTHLQCSNSSSSTRSTGIQLIRQHYALSICRMLQQRAASAAQCKLSKGEVPASNHRGITRVS
jgi:hypothetical protein